MSGPNPPATPPEVPEEFAEAYREAYERALAEHAAQAAGSHRAGPGDELLDDEDLDDEDLDDEDLDDQLPDGQVPAEEGDLDDLFDTNELEPVPAEVAPEPGPAPREPEPARAGGAHADWAAVEPLAAHEQAAPDGTEYVVETAWERFRASRAFVPALLALAALVLVGGAFGVGRIFAAGVQDVRPTASETAHATVPASDPGEKVPGTGHHKKHQKKAAARHAAKPWRGKVRTVAPGAATAACVAAPAVDAAGHRVTYQPANAVDGVRDTTWRCPGRAIGQELVVHLPRAVPVGEVGLVPGYAKTDPKSHVDRYAQNNRITRLRWILGHGVSVVQRLDGSAHDRSMRTIRVPRTVTNRIVLQVLAVKQGPFNTTCVSEVRVGAAA